MSINMIIKCSNIEIYDALKYLNNFKSWTSIVSNGFSWIKNNEGTSGSIFDWN